MKGCFIGCAIFVCLFPASCFFPTGGACAEPAGTPESSQFAAFNPVFIPFGTMTAEYERRISPRFTFGLSGWYEFRDVKARWAYAKCLWYPGGTAMNGLAVGCTAGVLRAFREDDADTDTTEHDTAPFAGVMIQYNRLFGAGKRYLAGIGIGGRSILTGIDDDSPLNRIDGDGRLVIGWLF